MEFVGGPLGSCIGELEGAFIKLKKEVVFMQAKVESSEKEKNIVGKSAFESGILILEGIFPKFFDYFLTFSIFPNFLKYFS